MQVIKPSWEILNEPDWKQVLLNMEKAIRTCYKSEEKITEGSAEQIIRSVIARGHESTLEHQSLSVRFICDRGVSHELVRHRLCSFSQESTRYVNYGKKGMQFILPCWIDDSLCDVWDDEKISSLQSLIIHGFKRTGDICWLQTCNQLEKEYNHMISVGWKPEQARSVLPNSIKTEIVVTTNIRDWRHIFHLRCDKAAHPQMRELMIPLYNHLKEACPVLFDSVKFNS